MSDKEIIKLEDVKKYSLNNGKYGKFIRVETNDNQCFNLSLDVEQKQKITKDFHVGWWAAKSNILHFHHCQQLLAIVFHPLVIAFRDALVNHHPFGIVLAY